jgi:hypothetical protein
MTQQVCDDVLSLAIVMLMCSTQIYHARSMYELRNGPQPSYAQLDGTEPEFEIRRARKVAVPREHAQLIAVSVGEPTVLSLRGPYCYCDIDVM